MMMEDNLGKSIYHLRVVSLKVPDMSLHFKKSGAPMMVIFVFMKVTCSYGLLYPANLANEGGLKFSGTGTSYISFERGWGSSISSSSVWYILCWRCWIWSTSPSRAMFWRHKNVHNGTHLYNEAFFSFRFFVGRSCCISVHHDGQKGWRWWRNPTWVVVVARVSFTESHSGHQLYLLKSTLRDNP